MKSTTNNKSDIFSEEEFDPKQAVVPGTIKEAIKDYYIFCLDPKASSSKEFLYYKKVFAKEKKLGEAQRILAQVNGVYSFVIITHHRGNNELEGCSESYEELILERIKEYNENLSKINVDAVAEFATFYRK